MPHLVSLMVAFCFSRILSIIYVTQQLTVRILHKGSHISCLFTYFITVNYVIFHVVISRMDYFVTTMTNCPSKLEKRWT